MKYKRKDHTVHPISRGFVVRVFPSLHKGEEGIWCAEITGPDIDQITCDTSPFCVMKQATDVVRILTGACTYEVDEHDYSIQTEIGLGEGKIPAVECARCHLRSALYCFDEID